MADSIEDTQDRVVAVLVADAWLGEWERPIELEDLARAAATTLRVVRDDITLDALNGRLPAAPQIEAYLNARIVALSGQETTTGDTTLPGYPGFEVVDA